MSATRIGNAQEFWQSSLEALEAEWHTDGSGLDQAEAARRLAADGPNVPRPRPRQAVVLQFLSRFGNPLVLLLLAASAISAFTGDVPSFVIISVVVAMSVTLDFVQEQRAGKAAEKLRQAVALHA